MGRLDHRIEPHTGSREPLRELFELAEDSPQRLDAYRAQGDVLVAVTGDRIVAHLQLVPTGRPGELEIKNMAVLPAFQRRGVGRSLVAAALAVARRRDNGSLLVGTAAADVDNLRFYQRLGFRMLRVERDAFTPADGYPPSVSVDGIDLRDRVWLTLER